MDSNLDLMGVAGMTFVIAFMGVVAWITRGVVLKAMDMAQTREQLKHNLKQEGELRRMAQQATQSQEAIAAQITGRLEALDQRLAGVERLLREVDEPAVVGSR